MVPPGSQSVTGVSIGSQRLVFADGASGQRETRTAASDAADQISAALAARGASRIDLLLVFYTQHHVQHLETVQQVLMSRLSPRCIVGISGEVVISGPLEMEGLPGLSLLAASLPGVAVQGFSSTDLPLMPGPDEPAAPGERAQQADLARLAVGAGIGPGHRGTIVLADPYAPGLENLLTSLARARAMAGEGEARRAPIVGGVASSSRRPGGNALLLNDRIIRGGVVGVSLSGPVKIDTVVSQGCRAFGPNLVVTSARGATILTLSGKPALEAVREAIESMPEPERQGLSRGMMLGRVISEYKTHFGRGDYLLRAILKVSEDEGAIITADHFTVGQTVRLHMRDAQTADEDLGMLLDAQTLYDRPEGCLLITCNARGTRLFPQQSHDARAVQGAFREQGGAEEIAKGGKPIFTGHPIPLAGFFAAGEIGPVGEGVFLHGQTACAVMFRGG